MTDHKPMVPRPTICRAVIYTDYLGHEHPAVVTATAGPAELACNLRTLPNGPGPSEWVPMVPHADPPTSGTWRWPPRA